MWNSTVTPLVDLVKHLIKELEGIAHATVDTGKGILHGNGRAIGSVGMLFVLGAGEAEAAEDVARVSKLGQVAEGAEVAGDAGKSPVIIP